MFNYYGTEKNSFYNQSGIEVRLPSQLWESLLKNLNSSGMKIEMTISQPLIMKMTYFDLILSLKYSKPKVPSEIATRSINLRLVYPINIWYNEQM